MKQSANSSILRSIAQPVALGIAACAVVLCSFHRPAFGQWKLASGFSNVNASLPNNVDEVSGLTSWGDSLLASAFCADDLLNFPDATPDSLFLSTDHGQSWTDFAPYGQKPLVIVGNDFIAEAQPSPADNNISDAQVSYSTDQGQTWTADTTGWNLNNGGASGGGQANSLVTIGSTIYAASTLGGVFQQSTPGATWTIDSTGIGYDFDDISAVGQLVASGNNLFLSAVYNGDGQMYVSTNQGASWSLDDKGLPTYTSSQGTHLFQIDLLASSGSAVFAAVNHDTDIFGGGSDNDTVDFYETTNAGQNWTKKNSSIENWGLISQFIVYDQDLFAVSDSGIYYSTNSGSTWTQANQGLRLVPGDYPNSVAVSGGNLVIGTNSSGAWYRPISDFGVSSVAASPNSISGPALSLSENPATDDPVNITYSIGESGIVKITMMDELGRSVRLLQNGPCSSGAHEISLDPLIFHPGTYFVRLELNGTSAMQKLVIAH